jgi:hypothetical protein
MTAGANYLALYMITAHLSEYLGVEDSEEEDRKDESDKLHHDSKGQLSSPAHDHSSPL